MTTCSSRRQNEPRLMIINSDLGVDDAQAIMMALQDYNWIVLGIFVHYGNNTTEIAVTNCVRLLASINKIYVPIYKCSEHPLVVQPKDLTKIDERFTHFSIFPPKEKVLKTENGISAMVRLVKQHRGRITLVCFGPLTDLALAHLLDPTFSLYLKECYVVGGHHRGMDELTTKAEVNFHTDPESANIVMKDFKCRITFFPWHVCFHSPLAWEFREYLHRIPSTQARVMRQIETKLFRTLKIGRPYILCDELAMAAILDEECICLVKSYSVKVELDGKLTRGRLVLNPNSQRPNVRVVISMNRSRVMNLLLRTYQGQSLVTI